MPTLQITFSATVTDGAFQVENLNPPVVSETVEGLHMRRVMDVPANDFATLETGDVTPKWWFVRNQHDETDLVVSFGASDDMQLAPGEWAWFQSSSIPIVKGVGAAGRVMYCIVEGSS